MVVCVELRKIYGRALDPIHVGSGGYRLGRADNTIVRDPATDLPKIPGTSLAGVARAFYFLHQLECNCSDKTDEKEKKECVEEGVSNVFGDESKKGTIRFYDGHVIFFPLSSVQGTVWITTKDLLEYWFINKKDSNVRELKIPEVTDKAIALKGLNSVEFLNLGWLLLEIGGLSQQLVLGGEVDDWVRRVVMIPEKLFSQIVNDNLEVRTSVRIDPMTGAAVDRGLFTYEAIPRGTVIGFEVACEKIRKQVPDIEKVMNAVKPYFKLLGIGGMGTRGFGRLELFIENGGGGAAQP
ncbi:MAG: type III-B CRISPR module RAMP protein Cmr4 [Methanomassiliicoccales archaeon]|nr:type III-B CRISPR module RAMP protein Cmr4 [Methanomassiliicoccales archaeon]